MKRVCIVEIKSGNHSVAELCKYANPEKNEVILFTTSSLLSNIENDLGVYFKFMKIITKDDNQSFYSFIQQINKICIHDVDLLILNTVSRWEFLFLKPGCPTYAYFYSLNFWFHDLNSPWKIFKNFFQINYLNILSWLPNRWHANPYFGVIIRKIILKKIDGIIVEYPPFVNLVKETYNVSKPAYFLPKRTYNNCQINIINNKIVFLIPGMISELRREYDLVIDAFENIPKDIKSCIKLIVLGRPIKKYGLRIIQRLKELDKSEIEIEYFTEFISHEKFSKYLLNADVIISPIKLDYHSGVIHEKFTYTKGTGTFPDMIRYAKPTIVPHRYNISKEFKDCFITYKDSSDLSLLIIDLLKNKNKLVGHKKQTLKVIEKYSLTYIQALFHNLMDDLISNNSLENKDA